MTDLNAGLLNKSNFWLLLRLSDGTEDPIRA